MAADVLGETWNISEKGRELITENGRINDKSTILKNALNSDLKEIGAPVINRIQTKNNVSQVVLQIQKLRNVSAPKANENSHAAPRMLKLVLTDGEGYIQAIETASIPSLSLERTPPGSKLLIKSAKICSGYVILDSSNCSLLGGQVPALCEKWELAKSVQSHNRQTSSDGPPAWVNFGRKIQADIQDQSFKSLDNKTQEKENTKFDLQRQDAIAEATSGAVKKVFGGGAKQGLQAPPIPKFKKQNDTFNREKRSSKKFGSVKEVDDDKPQKPLERVSLFDFLEDKLPANEVNVTQTEVKPVVNNFNPRNVQSQQNYKNRNNYNSKPMDQGSFHRIRSEGHFHTSQSRFDQNRTRKDDFPAQNKFEKNVEVNDSRFDQNRTRKDDFPTQSKFEKNVEVNGLSNNFEKMSINTQFASRSLKQHLNLGPQKKNSVESCNPEWKVGDDCVAKYWEDGKFYNATITAVTEKTCVVKFKGYGNIEEVLKNDCLPANSETHRKPHHTGPMEFRAKTYRRQ